MWIFVDFNAWFFGPEARLNPGEEFKLALSLCHMAQRLIYPIFVL
jgi:hypothetical protein